MQGNSHKSLTKVDRFRCIKTIKLRPRLFRQFRHLDQGNLDKTKTEFRGKVDEVNPDVIGVTKVWKKKTKKN